MPRKQERKRGSRGRKVGGESYIDFFCITKYCQLETLSQVEIKKWKWKSGTKSAQNTSKYSEGGSLAC